MPLRGGSSSCAVPGALPPATLVQAGGLRVRADVLAQETTDAIRV